MLYESEDQKWLAAQFEANRPHLRSVAYRMLGSASEAEDAVQESWLRVSRSDTEAVENLGGWLTRVVGRVCLDMLRSRKSRREEPLVDSAPEEIVNEEEGVDPEHQVLMADSVGLALLVVLDTLGPAERLAFVLHDLFGVPFDEIAPIVGRTPAAARQLASRARRRVQGQRQEQEPGGMIHSEGVKHHRKVVEAFLAAARGGDFDTLLSLLDPEVVLRSDDAAAAAGSAPEVNGARDVAGTFSGRARGARLALLDGEAGAVWTQGGRPRVVFAFTITGGKITAIQILADPARLERMDLKTLRA